MIVSDKKVETALEYLNANPAPVAIARKKVTDAENHCKRIYSRAYRGAEGTIEAKKCEAELDPDHIEARDRESEAIFELENERSLRDGAKMIIEVWMEESRNIRAAERVR